MPIVHNPGRDAVSVLGIGTFQPGEHKRVTEETAARLRGNAHLSLLPDDWTPPAEPETEPEPETPAPTPRARRTRGA